VISSKKTPRRQHNKKLAGKWKNELFAVAKKFKKNTVLILHFFDFPDEMRLKSLAPRKNPSHSAAFRLVSVIFSWVLQKM